MVINCSMEANWEHLNKDLLELIGEKVDSHADYTRFRLVCSAWRSFLPENPKRLLPQQFPYLLLPPNSNNNSNSNSNRPPRNLLLLNPMDDGQVADRLQLLEGGENLYFRGFSQGWLIALEKEGNSIYLIDTTDHQNRRILLPPINTFPDVIQYRPDRVGEEFVLRRYGRRYAPTDHRIASFLDMSKFFIRKVVLSWTNEHDYIAMAICCEFCKLGYCKSGDKGWTMVNGENLTIMLDIVSHKDKFYAVNCAGDVVVVSNFDSSSPTAVYIATPKPAPVNGAIKLYLVALEDSSLLLAARYLKEFRDDGKNYYKTTKIAVCKLILNLGSSSKGKWSRNRLKSLGDHVVFLGLNESMYFHSRKFPACKGNQIFFTDDYMEGRGGEYDGVGSDLGVFNYKDKSLERFHAYQDPQQLHCTIPLWVMGNP